MNIESESIYDKVSFDGGGSVFGKENIAINS